MTFNLDPILNGRRNRVIFVIFARRKKEEGEGGGGGGGVQNLKLRPLVEYSRAKYCLSEAMLGGLRFIID